MDGTLIMEDAKMAETETKTRKKGYAPTDADYDLCCIEIDEAENGVVVNCRYKLKPEIEAKMNSQRSSGMDVPYSSWDSDREKHVFEDKKAAMAFIQGELNEMWGNGASDNDDKGDE